MATSQEYCLQKLPANWHLIQLREICERITKGSTPTSYGYQFTDFGIRFIKAENIDIYGFPSTTTSYIDEETNQFLQRSILKENDLLFSIAGTIGRVGVVRQVDLPANTNQALAIIRLKNDVIDLKYLFYFLKSDAIQKEALDRVVGVGRANLSLTNLGDFGIPIAPIKQQNCIVAEIEKQFSRLDQAVENLKRVKANLKRYKAAVLKAAVEGKLTEQWRKGHPEVEPADKLLQFILAERRKRWEENELAKMKAKGKVPKDDKWRNNYAEPKIPKRVDLPSIPDQWVWANPQILAANDENAICAGPFGTIFKAKDFRSEGVPIIFLRHVSPGKYLTHKPGFMDTKKWEELFRPYSVFGGELLITKLGEPPGVCAIYPPGIGPAMVTPDVIKMSTNEKYITSLFLMNYFNSIVARNFATGLAFGTTRLRLTIPLFRDLPVPLPPLLEQQQIVTEIEDRFSRVEYLEKMIEKDLRRADRLRQAILKKAFSGQLIPSAQEYESDTGYELPLAAEASSVYGGKR
jgi:type I restriction enzyme S subunit